jgi:hypothetical protein
MRYTRAMHLRLALLCLFVALPALAADKPAVSAECTFGEFRLYGKIKVVDAFPDVKVKVVDAFPDLKVKTVEAFPDACGKWQMVDAFPDTKVKFVDAFPDVKIKYVDAFPGRP